MDYNGAPSLQTSDTNHATAPENNHHSCSESDSNHSNEVGVPSTAPFSNYDEKQHFQYQTQARSLNQMLQNNHFGPYGKPVSSNYQGNYSNLPRSQNETARVYYTQFQDTYLHHGNDVSYSKVDKMKCNDHPVIANDIESTYELEKSRIIPHDWKLNNNKCDTVSSKEIDKKIDKPKSIEMSDSVSLKPESHLNTDYNSNTSGAESSEKNDVMFYNANYNVDKQLNQSQLKQSFENVNYNQMMMHSNSNYYSQMRYPNPQNSAHSYMNPGSNPMLNNMPNHQSAVNYPPYGHATHPVQGYGYPPMSMHQTRAPYNIHPSYMNRGPPGPFPGIPEGYMNGTMQPMYNGPTKDPGDRKDEAMLPVAGKLDASDSGSTSNKSVAARSSKSKNVIKNESHPTTPVSNTIPSPSQTSISSIIDENEDSVSSIGPSDTTVIHHPVTQFNQHQINANMSQSPSMMYPQPYTNNTNNTQIPHPSMSAFPGHMVPQQRPFAPTPNMMPARQYHHSNETQINNSCFQKLLELGTEPERGPWLERYLKFMQENNNPLSSVPTVVKQPLDLFRLYHAVRERGGLLNVVKTKRWKDICHIVNVNASASGAYTLRRNYIKCLLDFECRFDRNGIDPAPILQEIQSLSDKKKKSTTKTPGSSSSSTISSGPVSQHNSSIARPSLPTPPDFSSPHQFPGHSPYNGALMHRGMLPYGPPRTPYPGPYPGPRTMPGISAPPPQQISQPPPPSGPMPPQARYEPNPMPPNWAKPAALSQQQWSSPSSSSNSNSTYPMMQMPVSPDTSSNSVSNSSQQSQPVGSLQEHTRRMDCKSNYGGMPPPSAPPPSVQAIIRGSLPPPTVPQTAGPMSLGGPHPQYHHSTMPHCNYPMSQSQHQSPSPSFNQQQQRPINPQSPLTMMPQSRHLLPPSLSANLIPDPMKPASVGSAPDSSPSCHNRSHNDNNRPTHSYQSQFSHSKPSSNLLKRYDHLFPPNCVEATQPDYSKKRKYISKDIRPFNATTVTMALKSGLLAEVSWALNHLNIWSRDESFFDKLSLKNIMPLFQALIDVWRHSLGTVFDYESFITELELPMRFEDEEKESDWEIIVKKMKTGFKARQLEDDKAGMVDEKCVEKSGHAVKLEFSSKSESIKDSRNIVLGLWDDQNKDEEDMTTRRKKTMRMGDSLKELWEMGGADSTMHIVPTMLSQRSALVNVSTDKNRARERLSPSPPDLLRDENRSDIVGLEESLFFEVDEANKEKIFRCVCVSSVIRNLSFVVGNDRIMGSSRTLLVILGRLLLLGHSHEDIVGPEDEDEVDGEWWAVWMDDIREHVLVTLVNIASYIDLDSYPHGIIQPIIEGLLHWLTCQSPVAEDPLPSHRVLGCRRLALECVMRLCVNEKNIDYIVSSTAAKSTGDAMIRDLFDYLALSFCCADTQVVREMSLAVMYYLSSGVGGGAGDSGLGSVYLASAEPSMVGGLISFIEVTEAQIRHVVDSMGMEALQARPDLMGTSLELLRHAGLLLTRVAAHSVNRSRFTGDHELRMLSLVISTVLDQTVAQSLSAVLYLLSNTPTHTQAPSLSHTHQHNIDNHNEHSNKFRSFLTFDDLSFCDKEDSTLMPASSVSPDAPASTHS